MYLAQDVTDNGSTDGVLVERNRESHALYYDVWGTFDGATVNLEHSPDSGATWVTLPEAELTAPGVKAIDLNTRQFRITVTNAGGDTDINATLN